MKTKDKYMTPKLLMELFEGYKKEVKSTPFIVIDWVGASAKEVKRQKEKPLIKEGFENYVRRNSNLKYFGDYFANTDNAYTDFIPVLEDIKREIREDQISGGMAQIYNSSITARLNNLVEQTENKHQVTSIEIIESTDKVK
jgi:hypothetical protein